MENNITFFNLDKKRTAITSNNFFTFTQKENLNRGQNKEKYIVIDSVFSAIQPICAEKH